ncbi:hypothetical protein HYPSUDRAFT_206367 [Hypholoma sublateritium FD-334 SS-4]|uniref:Uncharacterized protein n=1 Tax=Hypholoma sublateritium (strain FD-334 SS-4) TaxID=945553 RepID=A0A0D2NKX2_HYPSF|nr:hypothetical protein HYPSUDRAFT_206367 [Hypholoma sublateritium FD-334 SS-4]
MVTTAISVLYLANVANTGLEWFFLRKVFITHGETRGTAFDVVDQANTLESFLGATLSAIVFVISDSLLIWRCYKVWGNSLRAIYLALVLLLAETALYLSIVIIPCASNLDPAVPTRITLNKLTGAALFMTFGVTLLTTVLIAYPIYSFARRDSRNRTKRAFKDIAEVLVQSSAAYSLTALLSGVVAIVPQNDSNETVWFAVQNYSGSLLFVIAGMAPTIMVARVAMQELPQVVDTRTAHLSDLEFRGHSHPSGHTTQILSHGIRAPTGGRDNESPESKGARDAEKRGPIDAAVEGA